MIRTTFAALTFLVLTLGACRDNKPPAVSSTAASIVSVDALAARVTQLDTRVMQLESMMNRHDPVATGAAQPVAPGGPGAGAATGTPMPGGAMGSGAAAGSAQGGGMSGDM